MSLLRSFYIVDDLVPGLTPWAINISPHSGLASVVIRYSGLHEQINIPRQRVAYIVTDYKTSRDSSVGRRGDLPQNYTSLCIFTPPGTGSSTGCEGGGAADSYSFGGAVNNGICGGVC